MNFKIMDSFSKEYQSKSYKSSLDTTAIERSSYESKINNSCKIQKNEQISLNKSELLKRRYRNSFIKKKSFTDLHENPINNHITFNRKNVTRSA